MVSTVDVFQPQEGLTPKRKGTAMGTMSKDKQSGFDLVMSIWERHCENVGRLFTRIGVGIMRLVGVLMFVGGFLGMFITTTEADRTASQHGFAFGCVLLLLVWIADAVL